MPLCSECEQLFLELTELTGLRDSLIDQRALAMDLIAETQLFIDDITNNQLPEANDAVQAKQDEYDECTLNCEGPVESQAPVTAKEHKARSQRLTELVVELSKRVARRERSRVAEEPQARTPEC